MTKHRIGFNEKVIDAAKKDNEEENDEMNDNKCHHHVPEEVVNDIANKTADEIFAKQEYDATISSLKAYKLFFQIMCGLAGVVCFGLVIYGVYKTGYNVCADKVKADLEAKAIIYTAYKAGYKDAKENKPMLTFENIKLK